ncbi:MAG TPA: proline racemase family protein [Pyrinomonadaceae bacterium]|nr:proline racemase family protein [Pyrinomonadaceae bacterium]
MIERLENLDWQPPAHWQKITTIEMHTGGEPLRVITSGLPPIKGNTVLEKRRYFREHYDHIRRGIIWEPRGHSDMYAAIITPSADADADVFFLHNEGYSTMCGHAIIALTKFVIETGLVQKDGTDSQIIFNVPAGKVYARALIEKGEVRAASFRNVPSFLYLSDQSVEVPGLGLVRFDVAYGGAFYAFVDAEPLGLSLTAADCARLIDYGRRIKRAVASNYSIEHPFEDDLSFLYGTIFIAPAVDAGHHSRNVCIFAEGEVDRSPTGTGASARAAIHYAKGELQLNEKIKIESIVGSVMTVAAVEATKFGPFDAVTPEVTGAASITGRSEFYFDPDDPFREGFILR